MRSQNIDYLYCSISLQSPKEASQCQEAGNITEPSFKELEISRKLQLHS